MDSKIGNKKEQVKKIITEVCDGMGFDGVPDHIIEIASTEIDSLYSDPPSPEMTHNHPLAECPICCPKPEMKLNPAPRIDDVLQKGIDNMNSGGEFLKPEMVCPECHGYGKITSRYKEADHKCETCNGTGKVPSPEPPEKVWEFNKCENCANGYEQEEYLCPECNDYSKYKPVQKVREDNYLDEVCAECENYQGTNCVRCYAKMGKLYKKLQQAGWGNVAQIKRIAMKEENEIEQILGKVLGCPWYKNDLKNFPNATEVDGVCVGDDVPISLAMQAANRITKQEARIKELETEKEEAETNHTLILQSTLQNADEQLAKAIAEARQQAQGELSGWIRCPHCGSGAIIWGKDRILLECTNCGNKLQELPKE